MVAIFMVNGLPNKNATSDANKNNGKSLVSRRLKIRREADKRLTYNAVKRIPDS